MIIYCEVHVEDKQKHLCHPFLWMCGIQSEIGNTDSLVRKIVVMIIFSLNCLLASFAVYIF